MIMSLLVPVNTDKMRHSPAHLVEKNAQNVDFRRPPIRRLKKIIGLGTINNWNFFYKMGCVKPLVSRPNLHQIQLSGTVLELPGPADSETAIDFHI